MAALPEHFPPLADYTDPMASAMAPILSVYWDEAGKRVREQMGLDVDEWRVSDPHLAEKIHTAAFAFCESTNATTDKLLADALQSLRMELHAGIVAEGESVAELTKRVQGVFENAEKWRARRIAATEAARAVHAAQYQSVSESGVVAGVEWLISEASCPLCKRIAADVRRVRLGDDFAVIGDNPAYSHVKFPPLHPGCRCSLNYVLLPEYGGPESPAWGSTLDQPDPNTPPAAAVPEPEPGAKPPKVRPRELVSHSP